MRVRSEFSPPEPPNVAQATNSGIARAVSKLWIEQWRSFAERTGAELSRGRTAARLILDEEHARVFQDALATAHRRLLVVSDKVAPEVVSRELLSKMVERAKAGVSIRFVFNRFARRDGGEAKVRHYLDEAQASSGGRFTWVKADTRANLIVADDAAIVTSFRFLSYANAYVERAALGRRQSSELGVLCTGLGAADSLIDALKRTCPAAVEGFTSYEEVVAEEPALVPESAFRDSLQQILAALTSVDAEVQLEPAFANASDPWGLLEQVAASGIHGGTLRRAIAACLAVAGGSDVENRDRWVRRLASIAWEHADPFETAVLVSSLGAEVGEELPPLCALLADIGLTDAPSLGKVLEELLKWDEPTQCDSTVSVLLGVVALLGEGYADALDLLIHGAVLGAPWPNLAAEVETYWKETYEPFPTAHFKQLSRRAEVERQLDAEWSRLSERIDEASREHFKFPKGTMIWAYLFHPAGRFGRLRELAERRDAAGISAWLRTEQVDDLAAMLLSAAVEVHGSESHAIAGNKRTACIDALSTVVEEARELVRLSPGVSDVDTNWLIERATALRESLTSAWPDLEAAARAAVTVGVLPVVDRALRRIRQILAME